MDWIWSSRCIELLYTSTLSNNLKWASGGGINSPSSCWLKAVESSTVGWSDAMFFRASVHPVLLAVASTAHDRWHNCSDSMFRRTVGSSGAEDLAAKTSLIASTVHATVGWTIADPSVHPVLLHESWCVSVLFELDHRIDRRFFPLDCRFIRRYYLLFFFSATCPTLLKKWTVGSSDGALVLTQCTNLSDHYTDACYLGTVGSSDGVLSFPFLSHFWPLKNRLSSQFGMRYFGILGT
jgi:hypothetical protein